MTLFAAVLATLFIQATPVDPVESRDTDQSAPERQVVRSGNWTIESRIDSFSGQRTCEVRHKAPGEGEFKLIPVDRFIVVSGFLPFQIAEVRVNDGPVIMVSELSHFGRTRDLVRQLHRAGGFAVENENMANLSKIAIRAGGRVATLDLIALRQLKNELPKGC